MRTLPAAALGITLALALCAGTVIAADVYKWIDADGQTHYTQHQPPVTTTTQIAVRSSNSAPAGNSDTLERLRAQVEAIDERRRAEEEANTPTPQEQQMAQQRSVNCGIARANLAALQQSGRMRYFDAQGNRIRLSAEDKAKRIEAAKSNVDEYCS